MADGHGGARAGAGRKAGSATMRTRAIADQATQEGVTPLEVMLGNMRFAHAEAAHASKELEQLPAATGRKGTAQRTRLTRAVLAWRNMAEACACDAAPFMHPRLSPIDARAGNDAETVPLAERLKAYETRDVIEASAGKVVELKRKAKK